jgi:hypothetical protein
MPPQKAISVAAFERLGVRDTGHGFTIELLLKGARAEAPAAGGRRALAPSRWRTIEGFGDAGRQRTRRDQDPRPRGASHGCDPLGSGRVARRAALRRPEPVSLSAAPKIPDRRPPASGMRSPRGSGPPSA